MVKINLIKKEKGRVYKSEKIVKDLFGYDLLHNKDGAPYLEKDGQDTGLYISISDTKNYWACAIEGVPIGIDIEELSRKVRPAIVRRFHKDEREYLEALSEGGREWTEEFYSIWTRKEAYSKLRRKGLSIDFSRFNVLDNMVDGAPLGYFSAKGLMFGIAGDTDGFAAPADYDAPMEKSALDFAAGLLDVRAYSSAEILNKLKERGYKEKESEEAIEKLKEYGYINDENYAKSLARRSAESGKGARRIQTELIQKGLDKSLAKDAALEYKEGERERALEIANKICEKAALPKEIPDGFEEKQEYYEKRRKLAGKISRKLTSLGYEASIIYEILEDIKI